MRTIFQLPIAPLAISAGAFLEDKRVSLLRRKLRSALGENTSLLAGAYGYSLRLFVGPVAL